VGAFQWPFVFVLFTNSGSAGIGSWKSTSADLVLILPVVGFNDSWNVELFLDIFSFALNNARRQCAEIVKFGMYGLLDVMTC
jgi:hypothetical protein